MFRSRTIGSPTRSPTPAPRRLRFEACERRLLLTGDLSDGLVDLFAGNDAASQGVDQLATVQSFTLSAAPAVPVGSISNGVVGLSLDANIARRIDPSFFAELDVDRDSASEPLGFDSDNGATRISIPLEITTNGLSDQYLPTQPIRQFETRPDPTPQVTPQGGALDAAGVVADAPVMISLAEVFTEADEPVETVLGGADAGGGVRDRGRAVVDYVPLTAVESPASVPLVDAAPERTPARADSLERMWAFELEGLQAAGGDDAGRGDQQSLSEPKAGSSPGRVSNDGAQAAFTVPASAPVAMNPTRPDRADGAERNGAPIGRDSRDAAFAERALVTPPAIEPAGGLGPGDGVAATAVALFVAARAWRPGWRQETPPSRGRSGV